MSTLNLKLQAFLLLICLSGHALAMPVTYQITGTLSLSSDTADTANLDGASFQWTIMTDTSFTPSEFPDSSTVGFNAYAILGNEMRLTHRPNGYSDLAFPLTAEIIYGRYTSVAEAADDELGPGSYDVFRVGKSRGLVFPGGFAAKELNIVFFDSFFSSGPMLPGAFTMADLITVYTKGDWRAAGSSYRTSEMMAISSTIPLPSTLLLFGSAIAGLALQGRRRAD